MAVTITRKKAETQEDAIRPHIMRLIQNVWGKGPPSRISSYIRGLSLLSKDSSEKADLKWLQEVLRFYA